MKVNIKQRHLWPQRAANARIWAAGDNPGRQKLKWWTSGITVWRDSLYNILPAHEEDLAIQDNTICFVTAWAAPWKSIHHHGSAATNTTTFLRQLHTETHNWAQKWFTSVFIQTLCWNSRVILWIQRQIYSSIHSFPEAGESFLGSQGRYTLSRFSFSCCTIWALH